MKLRHGLFPLALAGALLAGAAHAPAAQAYGGHTVRVSGSMFLSDDENFGSDETRTVRFSRSVALTHGAPRSTIYYDACVGGEVLGSFQVTVSLEPNDVVVWQPTLRLYEGTSCFGTDLDGQVQGRARTLQPNYYQPSTWIQTYNKDESTPDDRVRVDYEVHHNGS
jgi:hypothetical protein